MLSDKTTLWIRLSLIFLIPVYVWLAYSSWTSPTVETYDSIAYRINGVAIIFAVGFVVVTLLRSGSSTGERWRKRWDAILRAIFLFSTPFMGVLLVELGLYWGISQVDHDPAHYLAASGSVVYILFAILAVAWVRAEYRAFNDQVLADRLRQLEGKVAALEAVEDVNSLSRRISFLQSEMRRLDQAARGAKGCHIRHKSQDPA